MEPRPSRRFVSCLQQPTILLTLPRPSPFWALRGRLLPTRQVFQDIDTYNMKLDNVVQLCFRVPTLPFVQEDTEPVVAEITLGHTFKVPPPVP